MFKEIELYEYPKKILLLEGSNIVSKPQRQTASLIVYKIGKSKSCSKNLYKAPMPIRFYAVHPLQVLPHQKGFWENQNIPLKLPLNIFTAGPK